MSTHMVAVLTWVCLAAVGEPTQLLRTEGRRLRVRPLELGAQVQPFTTPGADTPIHLLISAFQDGQRCAKTLFRALRRAAHPQRLSFNVLQAAGPEDVNCLKEFEINYLPRFCEGIVAASCPKEVLSRVHFWTIKLEEGKGPVHQRGLLSERADLAGEGAMCLSMDSHMQFAQGWDHELLEDWASANNEFAVMTAYPMSADDVADEGKKCWVSLCGYFLTEQGIPRGATGWPRYPKYERDNFATPRLTMNWAAGQSFSRCHAEKIVPADKNLLWMFNGEEVNRAVRLWTHGYDLYNPRVNVVLHNYSHASQNFWSYSPPDLDLEKATSEERLKKLLQGDAGAETFGRYGLGNQRTVEQYVTHFHTDLGGKWTSYLRQKGITPHFAGFVQHGAQQPGSVSGFCDDLQRLPVRNATELAAEARAPL
eukprot:CAMPEP_0171099630 /NCGR_PEP_ID=MMETSP0766_2-20121228/52117_1 /TAXON_ID=439317 /ORGANISM="Gambierdiscus australes, Strain CAWD 149" /LENGTH=423 /DNA_ID=CAMNT_0011559297 /DNA_START=73 /DNA_END=1344 /DNA_ORIENTATION=+